MKVRTEVRKKQNGGRETQGMDNGIQEESRKKQDGYDGSNKLGKGIKNTIGQYLPWLFLLLGTDAFGAFLLWLADVQAFSALTGVIVLTSFLFFFSLCGVLLFREQSREKAFLEFLDMPDEHHEEILSKAAGPAWRESVRLLGAVLREKESACNSLLARTEDYEEYVEAWAHETKMPLSLLTLLLDNRREELPGNTAFKLDYIRSRLQEFVDQMLFYARLKAARKDYLFENVGIGNCVREVLEDCQPLLEEKGFRMGFVPDSVFDSAFDSGEREESVYTDRRGFLFILRQVVSNAMKYGGDGSAQEPVLRFTFLRQEKSRVLTVGDNGRGVPECDLPYIFEKGFTGGSGQDRKKATGMGLYLAREMAGDLGIGLEARSGPDGGFEMDIIFPLV